MLHFVFGVAFHSYGEVDLFSPQRSGFPPRTICVGFVVGKVALGQFSLREIILLSPFQLFPVLIYLSPDEWAMNPLQAAVLEHKSSSHHKRVKKIGP